MLYKYYIMLYLFLKWFMWQSDLLILSHGVFALNCITSYYFKVVERTAFKIYLKIMERLHFFLLSFRSGFNPSGRYSPQNFCWLPAELLERRPGWLLQLFPEVNWPDFNKQMPASFSLMSLIFPILLMLPWNFLYDNEGLTCVKH